MNDRGTVVEVSSVALAAHEHDGIAGGGLELPTGASTEDSYSVPLSGWIAGSEAPIRAVEVMADGQRLAMLAVHIRRRDAAAALPDSEWAGRSGFRGRVGVATAPRRFTLELFTVMDDHSRVPIGTIEGERVGLPTVSRSAIQPVVITTLGRSGSTWLTWLLSRHPNLVTFRPYKREARVAGYHSEIFQALASPASYLQAVRGIPGRVDWWLGRESAFPPEEQEPEGEAWLGSTGVEQLLVQQCDRMEAFYREAAAIADRPEATHFVEKYAPNHFVQQLLWEVYPGMREIFLIRDFRDVASSIIAFDDKRGFRWSRPGGVESDEEFVRDFLSVEVSLMQQTLARRRDWVLVVRYEDLVLAPDRTLEAVFEYLGVDGSAPAVERVLTDVPDPAHRDFHVTSKDAADSVGRWRRDMSAELKQICAETLGDQLSDLGYPLE